MVTLNKKNEDPSSTFESFGAAHEFISECLTVATDPQKRAMLGRIEKLILQGRCAAAVAEMPLLYITLEEAKPTVLNAIKTCILNDFPEHGRKAPRAFKIKDEEAKPTVLSAIRNRTKSGELDTVSKTIKLFGLSDEDTKTEITAAIADCIEQRELNTASEAVFVFSITKGAILAELNRRNLAISRR